MTITWKLTDGDLTIENGRLVMVKGSDEVAQRIEVTLKHEFGEYFLNFPGGVPWYQSILGSKDKETALLLIRTSILNVPGVISVLDVNLTSSGRAVTISAQAEVQDGNKTKVTNVNVYGQLASN